MIQLGSHFRSNEQSRHSEWLRRRQWFIKAKQINQRRDEIADKVDDQFLTIATAEIAATQIRIREYQARLANYEARLDQYDARLDAYDEAVTRALSEHLERLGILQTHHAELLANAFVLEDGRRVFKSEDGTYVIDDTGAVVGADIVDPASIPDGFTTADQLTASFATMENESAEIDKLHTAQSEIDNAREHSALAREKLGIASEASNKDDITVQELDDLEAEIDALMPSALPSLPSSALKNLTGIDNADSLPDAKAEFTNTANPEIGKKSDVSFDAPPAPS